MRFWLRGGCLFEVAAWDCPEGAECCWNCGDDFLVKEDPDHPDWYSLYSIRTGTNVHVMYRGS